MPIFFFEIKIGKTDVVVQTVSLLYRNFPNQRILVVTHSNNALNQIFDKLVKLDVDERHMVRLGHGSSMLESNNDFTRNGRVNFMLERRKQLLSEVDRLAQVLKVPGDYGYTCEIASNFFLLHVYSRWELYVRDCVVHNLAHLKPTSTPDSKTSAIRRHPLHHNYSSEQLREVTKGEWAKQKFPFAPFFPSERLSLEDPVSLYSHILDLFNELEECRAFEVLRTSKERGNFIVSTQARIVAMTCTHASLARQRLLKECAFKFDSLVMEEAAQALELDAFIPLLLQSGSSQLRRLVLLGDHRQLPPVVKHVAFQKYSRLEQSLFSRLVRLEVPSVTLDAQARCRPSLAKLFNWRYPSLRDLPPVSRQPFTLATSSFVHEFQFVDVQDFYGKGETQPRRHFFQNLGEAEYIAHLFLWLRSRGHPASSITILTTYNGQKELIKQVLRKRCSFDSTVGYPHKVTTVDRFQGQQNDIILLSLVRTLNVGHLRDVRRLVVAMSRARLGLYVFGRLSLFENCFELLPVFQILKQRPTKLMLIPGERFPTSRKLGEDVDRSGVVEVEDVIQMGAIVHQEYLQKNMGQLGATLPSLEANVSLQETSMVEKGEEEKGEEKEKEEGGEQKYDEDIHKEDKKEALEEKNEKKESEGEMVVVEELDEEEMEGEKMAEEDKALLEKMPNMTVKLLKEELKRRGLATAGLKADLQKRLKEALTSNK